MKSLRRARSSVKMCVDRLTPIHHNSKTRAAAPTHQHPTTTSNPPVPTTHHPPPTTICSLCTCTCACGRIVRTPADGVAM